MSLILSFELSLLVNRVMQSLISSDQHVYNGRIVDPKEVQSSDLKANTSMNHIGVSVLIRQETETCLDLGILTWCIGSVGRLLWRVHPKTISKERNLEIIQSILVIFIGGVIAKNTPKTPQSKPLMSLGGYYCLVHYLPFCKALAKLFNRYLRTCFLI